MLLFFFQEISRLKKVFVAVYPYIHTGWEGAILWYQASYMFGKTDWHTPFLPLSDVILTYDSEPADDTGQSSNLQPWHDLRWVNVHSNMMLTLFPLSV